MKAATASERERVTDGLTTTTCACGLSNPQGYRLSRPPAPARPSPFSKWTGCIKWANPGKRSPVPQFVAVLREVIDIHLSIGIRLYFRGSNAFSVGDISFLPHLKHWVHLVGVASRRFDWLALSLSLPKRLGNETAKPPRSLEGPLVRLVGLAGRDAAWITFSLSISAARMSLPDKARGNEAGRYREPRNCL